MEPDDPAYWSWWSAGTDRNDLDRADLWLRALQTGQGAPALFHEPAARRRAHQPVSQLTRPARRRSPGRANRHQQAVLTLLVIALLAGGLARLSWLVAQQPSRPLGHSQIQTYTQAQRTQTRRTQTRRTQTRHAQTRRGQTRHAQTRHAQTRRGPGARQA
jgi:hypothetical protein